MLISIDYDDTYTADPGFWAHVIAYGQQRGHRFVCITYRSELTDRIDPLREPPLPPGVPVLYTGGMLKASAARRAGYVVNVWIDDMPAMITGGTPLPFYPAQLDDEATE